MDIHHIEYYHPAHGNPGVPTSSLVISSCKVITNPRHATVTIFNRGGNAGTIMIDAKDLDVVLQLLFGGVTPERREEQVESELLGGTVPAGSAPLTIRVIP